MENREKALGALCALALLAYFAWFTWPALRMGFTQDDLMNLHRSWHPNTRVGWLDVLLFFRPTDSYRPAGNLFYGAVFEGVGLNPLAFRIGCYLLLALNLWLAYSVARRISSSRLTGALCVLLLAYHREFFGFYVNTGMCYDLLCLTFFLTGFLFYLRGNYVAFAVSYLLCLNSKEVGVALPAVILCYEVIFRRPVRWMVAAAAAVAAILFAFGRVLTPQGLGGNARYSVEVSPAVYLSHGYYYLRAALYNWPTPLMAAATVLGLGLWAWRTRSKPLWFALAWMMICILPVAFIPVRELDSACVAAVGLAMSFAIAISSARRYVPAPVVFVAAMLALGLFQQRYGKIDFYEAGREAREIENVRRELPVFPKDARILFLDDPFPAYDYSSKMLIQLMAEEPSIEVYRADRDKAVSGANVVLSWKDGRLLACKPGSGMDRWSCGKPSWK